MINFYVVLGFSYSIAIAVIIGLIRFRKIYRAYQPFIFICLAGLCNELAATMLMFSGQSNAVAANIFELVECLLWLWQFQRWGSFKRKSWLWPALMSVFTCIWITEKVIFDKIDMFSSVFTIASSFCLVFLAIDPINQLIVQEKNNLLKNSKFLICIGIVIFYTYQIMVESFYIFKLNKSDSFLSNIFNILVFVNLFVNLLFALATLWIPTRQRFTLPS